MGCRSAAHALLRGSGQQAALAAVDAADRSRLELIRLFQADLGIRRKAATTTAPDSSLQQ
jgi:hypothetical protein